MYQPEQNTLDNASTDETVDGLQHQVAELKDQLRHAQRLCNVGTMAAMVVHEFNNILTPIVNYAQLAEKRPELTDKAIKRAYQGGQRATRICQAILGMTQQQNNPHATFPLGEMVEETVTAMARNPRSDGIDLSISVPAELTLPVSRIELQQVVLNLLLNARSAVLKRPPQRRIAIRANRDHKRICLQVEDNGVGIAPELQKRIFEPFFTTSSAQGGNGLGLAICQDIITSMGGEISLHSQAGEGACFTLLLPASTD